MRNIPDNKTLEEKAALDTPGSTRINPLVVMNGAEVMSRKNLIMYKQSDVTPVEEGSCKYTNVCPVAHCRLNEPDACDLYQKREAMKNPNGLALAQ